MRQFLILAALAVLVLAFSAGCCTEDKGSREFIPGKGWVPT